jgi:proteasome component ECM29
MWSLAFKVLDDVKESVRIAAMKLCTTLTKAMANAVNVDGGASQKEARIVLESLMPFLLGTYGIEAKAKEVQAFSLG